VKTGVQEIGKPLKTLDSGFRRNDGEKTQSDFFTPSPLQRGKERDPSAKVGRRDLLPLKREDGRDFEPEFHEKKVIPATKCLFCE
jgi:hypothetical protein